MKRALTACFILLCISCGRDRSPLMATGTGVIQIVVSGDGYGGTAARKLPEGAKKTDAAAGLENLEVRVLKSDNSVLDSRVFTPVDGVFDVAINVEALDNLKVLCIGMKSGSVEYFGLNEEERDRGGPRFSVRRTRECSQRFLTVDPIAKRRDGHAGELLQRVHDARQVPPAAALDLDV